MQLHPPPQYIQQWSASLEQSLGRNTLMEIGYLGSGGFHLQRSHLINNAQPGPGLIQPRRPFKDQLCAKHRFPPTYYGREHYLPCQHDQPARKLSAELVRRWICECAPALCKRAEPPGQLYICEVPENAPDFRSPMFEAAIPQNNDDLNAEKGPACDIRNRFAFSAVYDVPAWGRSSVTRL